MHAMNTVCDGLEVPANVLMYTKDQHVDESHSRVKMLKILKYIMAGFHYRYLNNESVNNINCYKSSEVGIEKYKKQKWK